MKNLNLYGMEIISYIILKLIAQFGFISVREMLSEFRIFVQLHMDIFISI